MIWHNFAETGLPGEFAESDSVVYFLIADISHNIWIYHGPTEQLLLHGFQ